MKYWIIAGVILIVAAITNPDKATHIDAVKRLFMTSVNEVLSDSYTGSTYQKAGAAIGYSLGMTVIDKLAESVVQPRNFVIFSLTQIEFKGESKIIGIGAFGNVWIFTSNKENILGKN